MPLPHTLLKPHSVPAQIRRAQRTITILAVLNVLLAATVAAFLFWQRTSGRCLTLNTSPESMPHVRVSVLLKAVGDDRELARQDTVRTPFATIFGKVENYATLKNALPRLAVTVQGTSVVPNPTSGEFAEKVALAVGENHLVIALSWDGTEQERYSYDITYATTTNSP